MSHYGRHDLVMMWAQVLLSLPHALEGLHYPVGTGSCMCLATRTTTCTQQRSYAFVFWHYTKVSMENKQGRKTGPPPVNFLPQYSTGKTHRCFPLRYRVTHLTRGHILFSMSCLKLKGTFMLPLGPHYSEINFLLLFLKNTSNIGTEKRSHFIIIILLFKLLF